ncbi:hypothetical protein BO82DRAFT_367179 [Aspergillus uvarum CBS 121591]|uniref:Uncharacterized protein n=1 Tax=Aspergillus uvarum CBS 121591 TaxID=1448315 RepID=A0A319C510_9EURO|nr:hypothetical protein BO82DRAFT_367179 [Aspergillus uvarum CBS 121591]PYH79050.1 hypothetical protein BO82DRAFT_367179 [Aspergillus uvarum CBS 121591]
MVGDKLAVEKNQSSIAGTEEKTEIPDSDHVPALPPAYWSTVSGTTGGLRPRAKNTTRADWTQKRSTSGSLIWVLTSSDEMGLPRLSYAQCDIDESFASLGQKNSFSSFVLSVVVVASSERSVVADARSYDLANSRLLKAVLIDENGRSYVSELDLGTCFRIDLEELK